MPKSVDHAVFDQFYRDNYRRVLRYVRMTARMNGMPDYLLPDLDQAAWTEASIALSYWKPEGGKSQFNWCAGPMKRAVIRAYRASVGAKAYGTEQLPRYKEHHDRMSAVQPANMAERIDLHRALSQDPKPQQIMRLVMVALSVTTGADIAKEEGICKQVVSEHLTKAKKRLRASLAG